MKNGGVGGRRAASSKRLFPRFGNELIGFRVGREHDAASRRQAGRAAHGPRQPERGGRSLQQHGRITRDLRLSLSFPTFVARCLSFFSWW